MILNYDHYRPGQRKKNSRAVLVPVLVVVVGLIVGALFVFHVPARVFGGGARPAPGKLPDLFKAEKYEDTISTADAILKGDPLNPVALSYKGFASFYRAVSQNAAEEKMHQEPRMEMTDNMPFDARRLIMGCFTPIHTMGRG